MFPPQLKAAINLLLLNEYKNGVTQIESNKVRSDWEILPKVYIPKLLKSNNNKPLSSLNKTVKQIPLSLLVVIYNKRTTVQGGAYRL